MRSVSLALALLLLVPIAVFSQTGTIGIYSDNTGTNCNITDAAAGLLMVYVVHANTGGATACQYKAPRPACFTASYLADTNPFPITLGSSQTGVTVGYGTCLTGTIHVQTILYFGYGTTPSCCEYPVLADPMSSLGAVTVADCDFNEWPAPGTSGMINPDVVCPPCGGYYPDPTVPHDPVPADGAVNQPLSLTLGWQSEAGRQRRNSAGSFPRYSASLG